MTLTHADIEALVPHKHAMCLWDEVLDWDAQRIHLRATNHRDPDHPLRSDGQLRALHLCEYGAQAMAVHGGLLAREAGGMARAGMLVALRDVDRLNRAHPERGLGALVLDQPLERHLRLVRAVLPDARRIGVLLGPDSVTQLPSLNRAATALQFQADVHEARQAADLVPALDHLLFAGDALLPLPDGLVSGPAAARTILLTSYRHRRPVFAHSAAYVTAGALAAVFSTPEHVAVDVADLLAGATEPTGLVRRIHSPRRFDVAVNRAVARALGLVIADEPMLRERIANGGAQ